MKSLDVYWHVYRRDQIKPEFQGYLICVLEVPSVSGFPVLRNILDPNGRDFPIAGREVLAALWGRRHHGVIFEGVCKSAIFELVALDPMIRVEQPQFASYNRKIILNARQFLLTDPDHSLEAMPGHNSRLLLGDLPLSPHEPARS
jgi:hypothetical protein